MVWYNRIVVFGLLCQLDKGIIILMDNIVNTIKSYNDCYEFKKMKDKIIIIFEKHNMALPIWGLYSNSIHQKCQLFTFDTHSDTHPPFTALLVRNSEIVDNNYSKKYCVSSILKGNRFKFNTFSFDDVYNLANNYINNTEQIKIAYDWNYILCYNIISSDPAAKSKEKEDIKYYNCSYHSKKNWINTLQFDEKLAPVIIDFDLDFFTCFDDFKVMKNPLMKRLINATNLITIAKEPTYFKSCKKSILDFTYTNESALTHLIKLIDNVS